MNLSGSQFSYVGPLEFSVWRGANLVCSWYSQKAESRWVGGIQGNEDGVSKQQRYLVNQVMAQQCGDFSQWLRGWEAYLGFEKKTVTQTVIHKLDEQVRVFWLEKWNGPDLGSSDLILRLWGGGLQEDTRHGNSETLKWENSRKVF